MIRRTVAARTQHMARMIQRKARRETEREQMLDQLFMKHLSAGSAPRMSPGEHARRCFETWDMVHSVHPYPKALAGQRERFRKPRIGAA